MKKTYINPAITVVPVTLDGKLMTNLSMLKDNTQTLDTEEILTREQREEWDIWAYPEEGIEEGNEYY